MALLLNLVKSGSGGLMVESTFEFVCLGAVGGIV